MNKPLEIQAFSLSQILPLDSDKYCEVFICTVIERLRFFPRFSVSYVRVVKGKCFPGWFPHSLLFPCKHSYTLIIAKAKEHSRIVFVRCDIKTTKYKFSFHFRFFLGVNRA